eukprot:364208-Chlamydomonas_euryale.AAC.40
MDQSRRMAPQQLAAIPFFPLPPSIRTPAQVRAPQRSRCRRAYRSLHGGESSPLPLPPPRALHATGPLREAPGQSERSKRQPRAYGCLPSLSRGSGFPPPAPLPPQPDVSLPLRHACLRAAEPPRGPGCGARVADGARPGQRRGVRGGAGLLVSKATTEAGLGRASRAAGEGPSRNPFLRGTHTLGLVWPWGSGVLHPIGVAVLARWVQGGGEVLPQADHVSCGTVAGKTTRVALYVEASKCAKELGIRQRGGFFENDADFCQAVLDGAFHKVLIVSVTDAVANGGVGLCCTVVHMHSTVFESKHAAACKPHSCTFLIHTICWADAWHRFVWSET